MSGDTETKLGENTHSSDLPHQDAAAHSLRQLKPRERLRADKPAQALFSQWAQDDANRTKSQREAELERWRDVK